MVVGLYMTLAMGVVGTVLPKPLKILASALVPYYAVMDRVGIDTNLLTKNIARGFHLSHVDWNGVNERRTELRWRCRELFESVDVLLTPIVPVPAFLHQTQGNVMSRTLTTAFLPATVAPVGLTPDGLPVGIQIVGPHLGDRTTIRFAELMAEVRGGYLPPPPLA